MAIIAPTNFARATLATPPSGTGGLSFTVAAGKGALFPSPSSQHFYGVFTNAARSAYEVVKIEARSTDSFTIEAGGRGADGTAAATWNTGDIFYVPTTNAMWEETAFAASSLAISALTPAADRLPYFTSASAGALATFTSFARTLLDDANAAAALTTLGAEPAFASTTRIVFQQTAAPTGYTKETNATYNDAALRFQTGTVTTGGADAFSTHFGAGKSTASYTLLTADIPSHTHTGTSDGANTDHTHTGTTSGQSASHTHGPGAGGSFVTTTSMTGNGFQPGNEPNGATAATGAASNDHTHTFTTSGFSTNHTHTFTSAATGGGGGHSHTLSNFNIKYVDVIIGVKD